jgi:hypothetical protein
MMSPRCAAHVARQVPINAVLATIGAAFSEGPRHVAADRRRWVWIAEETRLRRRTAIRCAYLTWGIRGLFVQGLNALPHASYTADTRYLRGDRTISSEAQSR